MDLYFSFLRLYHTIFIDGMVVSVLVILFCRKLISNYKAVGAAINILKWIILSYAVLSVIFYLVCFSSSVYSKTYMSTFWERATGPYKLFYWSMLTGDCVLPFALLFKTVGRNIYWLLLLAFLMNFGWLFESLTIHLVNTNRDYVTATPYFLSAREAHALFAGIIIGAVALGTGNLIHRRGRVA